MIKKACFLSLILLVFSLFVSDLYAEKVLCISLNKLSDSFIDGLREGCKCSLTVKNLHAGDAYIKEDKIVSEIASSKPHIVYTPNREIYDAALRMGVETYFVDLERPIAGTMDAMVQLLPELSRIGIIHTGDTEEFRILLKHIYKRGFSIIQGLAKDGPGAMREALRIQDVIHVLWLFPPDEEIFGDFFSKKISFFSARTGVPVVGYDMDHMYFGSLVSLSCMYEFGKEMGTLALSGETRQMGREEEGRKAFSPHIAINSNAVDIFRVVLSKDILSLERLK